MRLVAALIAAAAVATVVAVLVLGTRSDPRLAGTNGVDAGSFAVTVPAGRRHCQEGQFMPADADRLRMTIASFDRPMPPIVLTIEADGRSVVNRRVPAPPKQGVVELLLGYTTRAPLRAVTVCLSPVGRRIALGGFDDHARIEWLRPGSESVLGLTGTILHRFGIGKPGWMGGWTLVLAALLVVAVWFLTARLLLREATR
jgi:hypothetical protein